MLPCCLGCPGGDRREAPAAPPGGMKMTGDKDQDGHAQIHSSRAPEPNQLFLLSYHVLLKPPGMFLFSGRKNLHSLTFQNCISWAECDNHLAGRGSQIGTRGTQACVLDRRIAKKCPWLTTEFHRKIVMEKMVCLCGYSSAKMKARGVILSLRCGPVSAPAISVNH